MFGWKVFCADCKTCYDIGPMATCNWTPKPAVCGVCGSKWIAVKKKGD